MMTASDASSSVRFGVATLVVGVLSAFGSFMVYGTTYLFDPPGWVRIPAMLLFPLGVLVAVPLGLKAFKGEGKAAAIAGWVIAILGVAFFIYTIFSASY